MSRWLIVLIAVLGLLVPARAQDSPSPEIGFSFPPVGNAAARDFTQQHFDELGVRLLRFSAHWRYIEPQPGEYRWETMDERMAWVAENDYALLLTIEALGPEWACQPAPVSEHSCLYSDEAAFREFVTQLITRYSGQIAKIQYGNEWDDSNAMFIGSAQDYVRYNNLVYDVVQQVAPQIDVVLGGLSKGALQRIAGCDGRLDSYRDYRGNVLSGAQLDERCQTAWVQEQLSRIGVVMREAHYDIVDLHMYDDPENWPVYYEAIASRLDVPILVSEFGGPHPRFEPLDDAYHAERVQAYLEAITALPIIEAYYFRLTVSDTTLHGPGGLIRTDAETRTVEPRPGYEVFRDFLQNRDG